MMYSSKDAARTSVEQRLQDSNHAAVQGVAVALPEREPVLVNHDAAAGADEDATTSSNNRWTRKRGLVVLLAAVAGAVAWYFMHAAEPSAPTAIVAAAPLQLANVDIAVAEMRVLSRVLPLAGSMAPVVQATVKSKVGGEIEQLTVREGQDVRAGEVIARIDTRNLQAQYDRERAAVDKARADLDLATLNREKNRVLLTQRYISQNTFEQTESAYAGSVASVKLAEANARLAKINLDDAVVRAPFTGTIARRLVQPGEAVTPDSSIVTLVDLRELLLEAAAPADEIPAVNIGQPVHFKVGGFGQRQFDGEVQRISPTTNAGSRAITLYVAVPNSDRALKGGMFAQGELVLSTGNSVLSIPAAAVKYESAVPVVYTLDNHTIGRRQVTLGIQREGNDYVEVRAGLQDGERVIVADVGERKAGSAAVVRDGKSQ
jgi:RND family efflux transporter MFP subunit